MGEIIWLEREDINTAIKSSGRIAAKREWLDGGEDDDTKQWSNIITGFLGELGYTKFREQEDQQKYSMPNFGVLEVYELSHGPDVVSTKDGVKSVESEVPWTDSWVFQWGDQRPDPALIGKSQCDRFAFCKIHRKDGRIGVEVRAIVPAKLIPEIVSDPMYGKYSGDKKCVYYKDIPKEYRL